MATYFWFISSSILFFALSQTTLIRRSVYLKVLTLLTAVGCLIFLSGVRFATVGTDTANYIIRFSQITSFGQVLEMAAQTYEIGFWLLNYLAHQLSDEYMSILILDALIVTICYVYIIIEKSPHKLLSFVVFVLLGPYIFHFNIVRQGIALAFFFIATKYIFERSFAKYLFFVTVGLMFHKSIIVCAPLYFFFIRKLSLKYLVLYIIGFSLVLIFFSELIGLASQIDERYASYADEQKEAGGVMTTLFNLCLLATFFWCKQFNRIQNDMYDMALNMFFFGVAVALISLVLQVNPSGFLRLSIYFTQTQILLIPMAIYSFRSKAFRSLAIVAAIVVMLVYFYLSTSTFSNLVPYEFNPIISDLI